MSIEKYSPRTQMFHLDIAYQDIETYLHGTLNDLPSPWKLKGMRKAVDLIMDAVSKKKKIRILGDYDIDGVMATYILMEGLKAVGGTADSCMSQSHGCDPSPDCTLQKGSA